MPDLISNPNLYIGLAAILPAGLWVAALIGWMITEEVGVFEALIAIAIVFGLLLLAIRSQDLLLALGALSALIIAAFMYPSVRAGLHRRAHMKIDIELMRGAYRLLDSRPDNLAAKLQLAEICHRYGLYAASAALYREAGEKAAADREARRVPQHATNKCYKCGERNQPALRYCAGCGEPVLLRLASRSPRTDMALRLFSLWALAVAALLFLPAVAGALPTGPAVAAIVGLLGLSLAFAVRILRVGIA